MGQDKIGTFVSNLEKCCEELINIPKGKDTKTFDRDADVPAASASRKPEKLAVASASGATRADEKKTDPGKTPFNGQYLGTRKIDKDVTFDNPKVIIPYGNIVDSETMTDKDGKTKTNQFGYLLGASWRRG